MSWRQSQEFLLRLAEIEGEPPGTYQLLTSDQWEYACRAGTQTDVPGEVEAIAWYSANSSQKVHEVGLKQPNGWGLHDMSGNTFEWVHDWMGIVTRDPVVDPQGPPGGTGRLRRGGSYKNDTPASWRRTGMLPDAREMYTEYGPNDVGLPIGGLRIMRVIPEPPNQ